MIEDFEGRVFRGTAGGLWLRRIFLTSDRAPRIPARVPALGEPCPAHFDLKEQIIEACYVGPFAWVRRWLRRPNRWKVTCTYEQNPKKAIADAPALLKIEGGDALHAILRTLCARSEVGPVIPVGVEIVPFPAGTVCTEGEVGRLSYADGTTRVIKWDDYTTLSRSLREELERRGSVPLSGTPSPYR